MDLCKELRNRLGEIERSVLGDTKNYYRQHVRDDSELDSDVEFDNDNDCRIATKAKAPRGGF